MLHAIKRKLKKRERLEQQTLREGVSLERISSNLSTRDELGVVFDQKIIERENRLGRYIMILGPNEAKETEPSLLLVYPSCNFQYSDSSFERVAQFCYPTGMEYPIRPDDVIQNQFVFGLNEDGSLIFGTCTHFVLQKSCFIGQSNPTKVYCICTMTPNPQFSAIFKFHEFLISILSGTVTCIPANITIPEKPERWNEISTDRERFLEFTPKLTKLIACPLFYAVNHSGVNHILINAIKLHLHISCSAPVEITLTPDIAVVVNDGLNSSLAIASASFDYLFSYLSSENIVRYMRALMTEQRIVITGNNISAISMIAIASLAILSPMSYKGSLLPIIPDQDELLDFLDTPIPFVFGVAYTDKYKSREMTPDTTIFNINTGTVTYPDSMPHMPHASNVRKHFKTLLSSKELRAAHDVKFIEFRNKQGIPTRMKRVFMTKYIMNRREVEEMLQTFKNYNERFVSMEKLAGCRVRDTTDPNNPKYGFVKEAYMIDVPEEDYDFIDMFVGTQTFQGYCENSFFT